MSSTAGAVASTSREEADFLTLKEFARRTHYAVQTVYNKISTGKLTAKHGLVTFPGGRHRVDWSVWRRAVSQATAAGLLLMCLMGRAFPTVIPISSRRAYIAAPIMHRVVSCA